MIRKLNFPTWSLVTLVKVFQTELSEDGEPEETLLYDGLCYYSEKTKQTLDKERKIITLCGKIILEGDIIPGILVEGYIEIGGIKKNIFRTSRPRNPDGSVFSTVLELM